MNLLVRFTLLSLIGTAAAQKSPKFLFETIVFNNDPCTGSSGESGTCMTANECSSTGGTNDGGCAGAFGVCCVVDASSCGASVSATEAYINAPSDIASFASCSFTIEKASSNICQYRLDFDAFELAAPASVSAAGFGRCSEALDVTQGNGLSTPTICGDAAGQHMYIDAGDSATDTASLDFTGAFTSSTDFSIKVTQIECDSDDMAPFGCLQYFTEDTGTIESFNFGHLLENMDYTVCIKDNEGMCGVEYMEDPNTADSFMMTTREWSAAAFTAANAGGIGQAGPLTGDFCQGEGYITIMGGYTDSSILAGADPYSFTTTTTVAPTTTTVVTTTTAATTTTTQQIPRRRSDDVAELDASDVLDSKEKSARELEDDDDILQGEEEEDEAVEIEETESRELDLEDDDEVAEEEEDTDAIVPRTKRAARRLNKKAQRNRNKKNKLRKGHKKNRPVTKTARRRMFKRKAAARKTMMAKRQRKNRRKSLQKKKSKGRKNHKKGAMKKMKQRRNLMKGKKLMKRKNMKNKNTRKGLKNKRRSLAKAKKNQKTKNQRKAMKKHHKNKRGKTNLKHRNKAKLTKKKKNQKRTLKEKLQNNKKNIRKKAQKNKQFIRKQIQKKIAKRKAAKDTNVKKRNNKKRLSLKQKNIRKKAQKNKQAIRKQAQRKIAKRKSAKVTNKRKRNNKHGMRRRKNGKKHGMRGRKTGKKHGMRGRKNGKKHGMRRRKTGKKGGRRQKVSAKYSKRRGSNKKRFSHKRPTATKKFYGKKNGRAMARQSSAVPVDLDDFDFGFSYGPQDRYCGFHLNGTPQDLDASAAAASFTAATISETVRSEELPMQMFVYTADADQEAALYPNKMVNPTGFKLIYTQTACV